MGQQLEFAKKRLFSSGANGLTDVKLYLGSSRDTTAEDLASEINKVLSQLENKTFEEFDPESDIV